MRWHAIALGGEVLAHRGDAVCSALAAGLPRGCAQPRGSEPWAGGCPAAG